MIEKIRVSLWDIFTFFLTGLLAASAFIAFLVYAGQVTAKEIIAELSNFPASLTLVAAPVLFMLAGMLIEPMANYFDRCVLKYILKIVRPRKDVLCSDDELLLEEIRARYLGSLCGKIQNPYQLCKDYVEYKQLSTTFMVFLARFGFYRNCAFIAVMVGVAALILSTSLLGGVISLLSGLVAAVVFRMRADDFYSYQAPAIYRAFLIDKLSWVPVKDETHS